MNDVDTYLSSLPEWQKTQLSAFRTSIHKASPGIEEAIKWNVPAFIIDGKVRFTMAGFKAHSKYNFIFNGAIIGDPDKLFNNGFESKQSRSIDLREGDEINSAKLLSLIKASLQKS